jgi:hypothetical protein
MKINLRWSKKQLDIINDGISESWIKCYKDGEKIHIFVIPPKGYSLEPKIISSIKVVSEPKNGDIFDEKIGIRVAKLKFLKELIHAYNSIRVQRLNAVYKQSMTLKKKYAEDINSIKSLLSKY